MLEFQLSQYAFRYGLSEGIDPRQAPPGTLTTAENARWTKSGRIEKRYGVTEAGTGNRLTTLRRLGVLGRSLLALGSTDEEPDSAVRVLADEGSAFAGVVASPRPLMTWDEFATDASSGVSAADFVVAGNRAVVVWRNGGAAADLASGGRIFAHLIDIDTGVVLSRVSLGPCASFRLARAGDGKIGLLIYDDVGGTVSGRVLTISGDTLSASGSTTVAGMASGGIDMKAHEDGFIVACASAASNDVTVVKCSSSFYTLYATTVSDTSVGFHVAIEPIVPGASRFIVAYHANGLVRVASILDTGSLLISDFGPATFEAAIGVTNISLTSDGDGEAVILSVSEAENFTTVRVDFSSYVLTSTRRSTWNVKALSRVFAFGGRFYAYVYDSLIPSSFVGMNAYLVEVPTREDESGLVSGNRTPHPYVGKVFAGDGGYNRAGMLSDAHAMPDGSIATLLPCTQELAPSISYVYGGSRLVSLRVPDATSDHERCAEVDGETYIAGPVLGVYDGRTVFDYGWSRAADMDVPTSGGAGSVPAGTYAYGATVEFSSNAGRKHRSAAGYVRSFVAGGSIKVNVPVFAIALENKGTAENRTIFVNGIFYGTVLLYRTAPGGAVLNKLSVEPSVECEPLNVAAVTTTVVNDTASATTRPAIYTTGGVLDDEQPPSFTTMLVHASRIFGVAGDGKTIWFSKSFEDDLGYAPGFSSSFRITSTEQITALASLDDKLIVFGEESIRYMLGSGPAPNGDANDFTPLMRIQTDAGCIYPRSVVSTSAGILFASRRGIHLLGRDMSVSWIGRPVQDVLAAFPTVTSAVLVSSENQVRITCDDGASSVVLVYDTVEGQWSTYRYLDGARIADACMWRGRYTIGLVDGRVYVEDAATHLDAGAYVPMTLETAWISAAGPVAFQSVRRFTLDGEAHDEHALMVSAGFDSDAGYAQSHTFAADSPVTTVGPLESCDVIIGTRRKCQRIRFRIQDVSPGPGNFTTGRGPSFSAMGLEVGAKKGFRKKPSTQVA